MQKGFKRDVYKRQALVGIGAISKKTTSTLVETGSINEEELKKLKNLSLIHI